jgi:hypothetical protein
MLKYNINRYCLIIFNNATYYNYIIILVKSWFIMRVGIAQSV